MPRATIDRPADQFFWEQMLARLTVPRERVEGEGKYEWFARTLNFYPHDGQKQVHDSKAHIRVVKAGKKAGKSSLAWAEASWEVSQPGRRGWISSSTYENTDKVFNLLWNEVMYRKIARPAYKDRRVRLCELEGGGMFKGRSWDNEDALEQESLDWLVIDEGQYLSERVWEKLYARVTDRNGWILAMGSAVDEGNTGFWDELCAKAQVTAGWEYFMWPTSVNPKPEIQQFLVQARTDLSPEAYDQLYNCVARVREGLVFGAEFKLDIHVAPLSFDPEAPVEVWVDPGKYYAVLAVQFKHDTVQAIDEVYMYRPVTAEVIMECKNREWWPKVVGGVIDVAGRQHHNDKSEIEKWQHEGGIFLRSQFVPIAAGIDRLKTFLVDPFTHRPRIFFDPKCRGLISEFRLHVWSKGSDRLENRTPVDSSNHAIKALIYGLLDRYGFTDRDLSREGVALDYRNPEGGQEAMGIWYELPY